MNDFKYEILIFLLCCIVTFFFIKLDESFPQIRKSIKSLRKPSIFIFFSMILMLVVNFLLFIIFPEKISYHILTCLLITFIFAIGSFFILRLQIDKPINLLKKETQNLQAFNHKNTGIYEIDNLAESIKLFSEKEKNDLFYIKTMSSDITHDIKNPLAVIRLTCEVLQYSDINEEQILIIKNSIKKIEQRINDEKGKLLLWKMIHKMTNKTPVNISEIVNQCIYNIKLVHKDVEFDFDDETSSNILCEMDYVLLIRILENIIDNAASLASQVLITSFQNNDNLIICVEDNGNGVEKEDRGIIFSYSYSKRKNENNNHSGIGLAAVKSILTKYNGEIKVDDSITLGGAKFTIRIPLKREYCN